MKTFGTISIAIFLGLTAGSATAQEGPDWNDQHNDRFQWEVSDSNCHDWSARDDVKALFPDADLECVNGFLREIVQNNQFAPPKPTRRKGFRFRHVWGDWELVAYDKFFKDEIPAAEWQSHLAPFSELSIAKDETLVFDGNEGRIVPSIVTWAVFDDQHYDASGRFKDLPWVVLSGSTEFGGDAITFSPCSRFGRDCMIVDGVHHLKDGSTMSGFLVYKRKQGTHSGR